jgi:hypothetical protein
MPLPSHALWWDYEIPHYSDFWPSCFFFTSPKSTRSPQQFVTHRPVCSRNYIFVTRTSKMLQILSLRAKRRIRVYTYSSLRLCNYSDGCLTIRQLLWIFPFLRVAESYFIWALLVTIMVNVRLPLCPSTSARSGVHKSRNFIERTWQFIV